MAALKNAACIIAGCIVLASAVILPAIGVVGG